MSSILASVSVLLGAEISEFKAKMAEARRELSGLVKFSEGLKDVGKSLTQYVTLPLLALGAGAVAASGKVESLRNALTAINTQDLAKQGVTGLGAMGQAADLTRERMKALEVLARQPGLGFEQAVQGDVRLRAVGISAEQSAKSIKAFANAIALTGGGKTEFASVTVQLAQLSAKGKVLAQDLRPIIEAAPAVSGALQKLYGTVDSETISASLAKQGKSSTDFIAILTDELGKLPQVAGSLKNSLENFADTATLSLAKLGDGISQALNLPAVLASVSNFVTGLADKFAGLSPAAQKVVVVLAGVAAAAGPVAVALGTLGAATPAVIAGYRLLTTGSLALSGALGGALKAAMAALLSPTGAVIAVLATLAAVVYAAATANERAYESFRKQAAATRELDTAVSPLLDRYEELKSKTSRSAEEQEELRSVVQKVTAIMPEAGTQIDQYGNFIEIAADKARQSIAVFKGLDKDIALASLPAAQRELKELEVAYASAQKGAQAFSESSRQEGIGDALRAEQLGYMREGISDLGARLQEQRQRVVDFQAAINGLNGAMEDASVTGAVLREGLSGGDIAGALSQQVGLLAELEEKLKAAKEARPNLTTEAEIAASNQLIASLEAQIKRLNELGIASKKMADAWAEVQKSLRLVVLENQALAGETSLTELKIAALEAGIKRLVDAGFAPYGQAVSSLVRQHQQLNAELGATQNLQGKIADIKLPTGALPTALPYSKKTDKGDPFFKLLTDREEAMKAFSANMKALTEQLNNGVGPLLADFAGQFGDAFGSLLTNTASVGDAMAQLFSGVLGSLASFMGEFGKQLIAIGIGKLGLDTLFAGPQGGPLAIAAGVGLVALAGVAKGIASQGAANLKGIGGGATTTASANYSRGANYGQAAPQGIRITIDPITLRAAGADLAAVTKTHEYRQYRSG